MVFIPISEPSEEIVVPINVAAQASVTSLQIPTTSTQKPQANQKHMVISNPKYIETHNEQKENQMPNEGEDSQENVKRYVRVDDSCT